MTDFNERRRWQRRALSATVLFKTVQGPGGHPFRSGRMRDVSDGGVSFDTSFPPAEGTVIDMFFKVHAEAADQRVRGRVAWIRPHNSGQALVGVAYVSE